MPATASLLRESLHSQHSPSLISHKERWSSMYHCHHLAPFREFILKFDSELGSLRNIPCLEMGVWWHLCNHEVSVVQHSLWILFQNNMDIQRPRPCEIAQRRRFVCVEGDRRFGKGAGLFFGVSGNEVRPLPECFHSRWKHRTLAFLGPFPSHHFFF